MSQGTAQQAAAAEEASASMEQMAANICQSADNAKVTERMAVESAENARQGGKAVAKTIQAMRTIQDRISIIQELANQTTILSMNASIEAAKAQDFGKGFAVVAMEIRNLANRCREAADEIDSLVKTCVTVSEQAGAILQRLVPTSEKTAELVQEISASSSEQSTGTEQINRAIQQLDTVIQQNATTAEEMATSAEELSAQAEQLQQSMAFFTVKERPPEASQGQSDLLATLQTLVATAKGADEQILTAMLKAVISSSLAECPAPSDGYGHLPVAVQPQEQEPPKVHPSGHVLAMPPREEIGEERDQEFECY